MKDRHVWYQPIPNSISVHRTESNASKLLQNGNICMLQHGISMDEGLSPHTHTHQPSATSLKKVPTATMSFHPTKVLHQNTFRFRCLNKPSSRSYFGDPLKVQLPFKQVASQTNCLRLRFYLACPLWSSYIACRARQALELVHQECPSGRVDPFDTNWCPLRRVCLSRISCMLDFGKKTCENHMKTIWKFHKQKFVKSK